MTVIACRVTDDKIMIAADTQITKGDCLVPGVIFPKIRRISEIYIAASGRCDEAAIFFNFVEQNSLPTDPARIAIFMSEFYKYRDQLNECLKPKEDENASGCNYIFIIRGKVYVAGGMVAFEMASNCIFATGSGEEFAMGAMAYGATVQEACAIACKYDINCSEPIDYFEIDRPKEG